MLDTIWAKQLYLNLIRPQDMVPVIHALGQVVFSKLFAGFLVSQLQKRLPSGMTGMQTDLCVAYGLSTDKLTFHRGLFQVEPVLENLCMTLATVL